MKIIVGKVFDGERRITVVPRWAAHMGPIQVCGTNEEAVTEELLAVILSIEARERPPVPAAL